jgi:hypothetical protein
MTRRNYRKFTKRPKAKEDTEIRDCIVSRNGRFLTFGFGMQYTDYADFAGRTTQANALAYATRDPAYTAHRLIADENGYRAEALS